VGGKQAEHGHQNELPNGSGERHDLADNLGA
jgi:hypothetical protein